MGRTAARFALRDRLAGTCRSKRRAAACTAPFSRPRGSDTNDGRTPWTGSEGRPYAPTRRAPFPAYGTTFLSGYASRRNPMQTDGLTVRFSSHRVLAVAVVLGLVLLLFAGAAQAAPGGGTGGYKGGGGGSRSGGGGSSGGFTGGGSSRSNYNNYGGTGSGGSSSSAGGGFVFLILVGLVLVGLAIYFVSRQRA